MKKTKGLLGLWLALVVSVAMLAAPTLATGVDESAGEADFEPWLMSNYYDETPAIYYYTIEASSNDGGSISPEGRSSVIMGGSQTFTIAPDEGVSIKDVVVDGVSVGPVESYTFKNVWERHTIEVTFVGANGCLHVDNCPSLSFVDLNANWYHAGVDYVVSEGIMGQGTGDRFSPNQKISREQFITTLWRLGGSQPSYGGPHLDGIKFYDVADPDKYYFEAAWWAADNFITTGYGNGEYFGVGDPVTREQVATFLYRFAESMGVDLAVYEAAGFLRFDDCDKVSTYAEAAMEWMCENGVITGSNNQIRPQAGATRAEIAVMIHRFSELPQVKAVM